jgi:type I restriction enzyme M protein
MFETFRDKVFPFIKNLNTDRESAYSRFMKDAVSSSRRRPSWSGW